MNRLPYAERVRRGKQVEEIVKDHLRHHGYIIRDATPEEDKFDKIDGYISPDDGRNFYSLQIKYRNSNNDRDDVLMEVTFVDTTIPANPRMRLNGRDYIGKAEVYACMCPDGYIKVVSAQMLKEHAEFLTRRMLWLDHRILTDPEIGQVRMVRDAASGRRKVIFFADISKYKGCRVHKVF